MAFNGFSRHSESIWFRYENKNVNTFGYKPYIKGKFISFVCFVCLFVVSFPFLSFSFPWWSYLLQYLPRAVGFSHAGIFTRAEGRGAGGWRTIPSGNKWEYSSEIFNQSPENFSGCGSKCFWPLTDTQNSKNRFHVSTHFFAFNSKRDFNG